MSGAVEPHCATCKCGRWVPVQRSRRGGSCGGIDFKPHGEGVVSWVEHCEAWAAYDAMYGGQDAEKIAERGGFGYGELVEFLGREPTTWRPR